MATNIVAEWLRSLRLGQYADGFIDNGYDDLEICKQVGDPDLDAIGVLNPSHRSRLLASVRSLREEGAASVYFALEAVPQPSKSKSSSGVCSETPSTPSDIVEVAASRQPLDEYEEGKAELVRIPRGQLKGLLREQLGRDGVRLSEQPYSTTDGDRGYLEGLASRYADLFRTHYGDVLGHLEDLRRSELAENCSRQTENSSCLNSQQIYIPGKYSPSSCLTNKEEDEIYGFTYGPGLTAQLAKQQLKALPATVGQQPMLTTQPHQNYQTCLSPRSAYFYEFPPNEQTYTNTTKKKMTFSRFLRGLKAASHRKEKHGSSSPRHGRASTARGVPQRVDTPDSVLQSGLALNDLGTQAVLRSIVDPRDYDRLRRLQADGRTPNTFEETISRLKLQEALRKREKFTKEHEEILRDIKQGLLQLGKEGIRGPFAGDDTYMYDEEARMLAPSNGGNSRPPGHWYDEPPSESDPEDFLMGTQNMQQLSNGRACFTLDIRQEPRGEGVISLMTAGDISLPRDPPAPRRGLILPSQAGYPPAIIPLRSSRDRESGDYASSDIQSVGSRISAMSIEGRQVEQLELVELSPQYYPYNSRHFRRYPGSEDELSPRNSSDYEDQEDISSNNTSGRQIATVHASHDNSSTVVSGMVDKVRNLREDVQRKISRLKNNDQRTDQTYTCSASSVESLPSGSGSSTQALVRAGSNHSSISTEEAEPSPTEQIVGRARALVDHVPSPYDKEALKFKAGDIIDITSMSACGQWKGICRGRKGTFKFINVDLLSERSIRPRREVRWQRNIRTRPVSVEDLLQKIGLPEYISVFVLNGYEDLELFKEIEPSDMDYLGIINVDHRAKIMAAVQMLHDLDSGSDADLEITPSTNGDHHPHYLPNPIKPPNPYPEPGNNLDAVVECCSSEILARIRRSQKTPKADYQPNIPNSASGELGKAKETYVGVHGQTLLADPCRRSRSRKVGEEMVEADPKLAVAKYVTGCEMPQESGSLGVLGRSCLSEKSSDSGVSSSSLSSTIKAEVRPSMGILAHHLEKNCGANISATTANK